MTYVFIAVASTSVSICAALALWVTRSWPISVHPFLTPFFSVLASLAHSALVYTRFPDVFDLDSFSRELCPGAVTAYYVYLATEELLFIQRAALFQPFDTQKQRLLRTSCAVFLWTVFTDVLIFSIEVVQNDITSIYCSHEGISRTMTGSISVLICAFCGTLTLFSGLYCVYQHFKESDTRFCDMNTRQGLFVFYCTLLSVIFTYVMAVFWVFRPWLNLSDIYLYVVAVFDTSISLILSIIIFLRLYFRHYHRTRPSSRRGSIKQIESRSNTFITVVASYFGIKASRRPRIVPLSAGRSIQTGDANSVVPEASATTR